MSQNTANLCVLLVNYMYGELPSRVLKPLFLYGRLSYQSLLQHTDLNRTQLQHTLAVLVQEHLVFWYTAAENGVTSYEANPINCYNLVRTGKYVAAVEERFGKLAGELVAEIAHVGHVPIGDLIQGKDELQNRALNDLMDGDSGTNAKENLCNGSTSPHADGHRTLEAVECRLLDLLGSGLLSITHESHFRTSSDNRTEAEALAPALSKIDPKLKKEEATAYEKGVATQIEIWKYGSITEQEHLANLKRSKKRPLDDVPFERAEKRQRLTNGAVKWSNGDLSEEDVTVRINHDKFMVLERNRRLVELAKSAIGPTTSRIYAKVLQCIEPKVRECQGPIAFPTTINDIDDGPNLRALPQVKTNDLRGFLTDDTSLGEAIGHAEKNKINTAQYDYPTKRRRKNVSRLKSEGQASPDESRETENDEENPSGVELDSDLANNDEHDNEEFDSDDITSLKRKRSTNAECYASPLEQHLLLLSDQPCKLLHHLPAIMSAPESWSVDYRGLSRHLLTTTIFQIINSRFGPLATRLVRILHQKGKLDEKTLTSLGLINQKSMRALLAALNRAGFVEIQEIPKDNNRQPGRMIFLWFFDEERCKKRLLDETYKAMTRVLQRIDVEKEKVRYTVEKSERTDVQGHEEELLGKKEKEVLRVWRKKEERLLGELSRLDDLVAVLRDF